MEFWDRHGKKLDFNSNPLYKEGRERIKKILVKLFGKIGYFLFDGELRHNKVTGIQCKLILWDCFIYAHNLLNKRPYWSRHAEVDIMMDLDNTIVKSIEQFKDNFRQAYEDCISGKYGDPKEFEGLVLKNLNGMLNLGRNDGINSNWMYKVRKPSGSYKF